jgi:hypothetical protein
MRWLGKQKAKHLSLDLHKISIEIDNNLKTTLKWYWKIMFVYTLSNVLLKMIHSSF